MKINRPFNTLTASQYGHYIAEHKRYTDFNTLGLYRSLLENEKLSLKEKLEVRDLAHTQFKKTFDFLQLKDPYTYFRVSTLGMSLTRADESQWWNEIRENQERIIKKKKLNHRNFGTYSRHTCSVEGCPLNGVMFREGSRDAGQMWFASDRSSFGPAEKSAQRKKERKQKKTQADEDMRLDATS